jgi:hypothetical protein
MSDILDVLNKNSGALSAVFSGVVTVATVIYAWLTAKLVQETRQMRQVQTEPRIQVTYRVSDHWINFLDISVRNIGLGPAHDISFVVHGETDVPGTKELVGRLLQLATFKKGLAYLGPNEEYLSFWTSLVEGDQTKVDSRLRVEVSYRSSTGTRYRHDCILDLSDLKGSSRLGEPPLLTIAQKLKSVAEDVHHIATGFHRPKVDVFTADDRVQERAQLEERFQEARKAKE